MQCQVRCWLARKRLRERKVWMIAKRTQSAIESDQRLCVFQREARSVDGLKSLNSGLEHKIIQMKQQLDATVSRTAFSVDHLAVNSCYMQRVELLHYKQLGVEYEAARVRLDSLSGIERRCAMAEEEREQLRQQLDDATDGADERSQAAATALRDAVARCQLLETV